MNDELKYTLALLRVPGLSNTIILKLLQNFSPKEIFLESQNPLSTIFQGKLLDAFQSVIWKQIDTDRRWLDHPKNHLITIMDNQYPDLLREIANPPALLFVKGDPSLLNKPQLAVVGSRSASKQGIQTAMDFSSSIAKENIVITSGLSLGIDAAAHKGAIIGEGKTIAVVGTSLDRVYPACHKDLAGQIIENGALVSEYPLGTPAIGDNFPARNRIISGLCLGVLVIEAAQESSSLGVAHSALEQNREVFAIPGSIHNPLAKGCNSLIRQGAKLVDKTDDIFEELGLLDSLAPH